MTESRSVLRRYTDLSSLLDIVDRRAITLLPPSTWDDGNDRLLMNTYAELRGSQTLLALCLTRRAETYHHWKVFAGQNNGICIYFRRDAFTQAMKNAGVRVGTMKYLTIEQLDAGRYPVEKLPFLKRAAFRDEGEVRAVYENKALEHDLKRVDISLDMIELVRLNPWMPKPVADSVRKILESLRGKNGFSVKRSSMLGTNRWREFAAKYKEPDLT